MELPEIKEAMPEYAEVNAQVLQDVVLRVDHAFQRSSAASAKGSRRATRASRGAATTTASPTRKWASMAARDWITAS
jgi:hypothetical protein